MATTAVHILKNSFNSGELSPLLEGRVDAAVYNSGCSQMTNFLPRVHGGAFKRPGTQYVGRPKSFDPYRLHGFKRSTETNYVLEFGGGYIRLWRGGNTPGPDLSLVAGLDFWSGSNSGGAWVTATGYVIGVKRTNKNIVFTCIQNHLSSAASEPGVGDDWSQYWAEIPYYEIGDQVRNGSTGYYCKTRHYPSTTFAADAAFWHAYDGDIFEIPTPYLASEVFDLQFTQLNDVLFIAHPNHYPKRLSRFSSSRWVFEDVPFQFAPSLDLNEDRTSVQVQFEGIPAFGLPWVATTGVYAAGDRVHGTNAGVLGRIYECILGHTASAAGAGGNEPGVGATWTTYWTLISATGYVVGDRVTAVDVGGTANPYNGQVFTCHTAYNPGTTSNDEPGHGSNWTAFWNEGTSSIKIASWAGNVSYVQGAKVRSGKAIYECIRAHKSVLPGKPVRPGGSFEDGNQPGVSKSWVRVWRVSSADTDLSGLSFALYATDELFSTEDVGKIWILEVGTGGIFEQITTPNSGLTNTTANNPLFIQGAYNVTSSWNTDDAMLGTISVEESLDGVVWNTVKQFTQLNKKDGNISYSGEAPSVGAWYRIKATATATPTALSKIKIEASISVLKLPFKITSYSEPTKVLGYYIMPGDQLPPSLAIGASTSLFRKPAFTESSGFPRAVAFHDSRLWWGGTLTNPARMWASHVEDFYIYLTGTLDTDGLDLTLAAIESNSIQWMASFNRALVISTTGDEWTIDSGEVDSALTPTNIRARRRTRFGSNGMAPQLTGDALLWVQRGSAKLREFAYNFQKDGFDAPDLTIFAEHIMNQGVTQMAYTATPEPILWMVNGLEIISFSYNREQAITAWASHLFRDTPSTIAVIYGQDSDELWMGSDSIINRVHPGTFERYFGPSGEDVNPVNRCFVDRGVRLTGTYNAGLNRTEFTGIPNPFNEDGFVFFADDGLSYFVTETSTTAGFVSGNIPNKTGWMGITYAATIETMLIEVPLQTGVSQGRKLRISRADLNLYDSFGGAVSSTEITTGQMEPMEYTTTNDTQQGAGFTGKTGVNHINGSWSENLKVRIYQESPSPFNILSLTSMVEVSGE